MDMDCTYQSLHFSPEHTNSSTGSQTGARVRGRSQGDGGDASPNQKVGGHHVLYPPNHDDSAANVIVPPLNRPLCLVSCRPHSSFISQLMTILSENKYTSIFYLL